MKYCKYPNTRKGTGLDFKLLEILFNSCMQVPFAGMSSIEIEAELVELKQKMVVYKTRCKR
jgi:hypothetical protein